MLIKLTRYDILKISNNLSDSELEQILQSFYEYFEGVNSSETGNAFEDFLREYLTKIGLDEVIVTQRSRDGGIDLTALRRGVGEFSDSDITSYYVQAKRNLPSRSISPTKIRELKGTIPFGHKGIFITTARFSQTAIEEASNDQSKPVVLIDGKSLVMSCIDNGIGFVYKPIFSKNEMDIFMQNSSDYMTDDSAGIVVQNNEYIEKKISANDIRARIVRVPSKIMSELSEEETTLQVIVNNTQKYRFNIDRSRTYLGGVTDFLKMYSLLSPEGVAYPKTAKWYYDNENNLARIFIEVN